MSGAGRGGSRTGYSTQRRISKAERHMRACTTRPTRAGRRSPNLAALELRWPAWQVHGDAVVSGYEARPELRQAECTRAAPHRTQIKPTSAARPEPRRSRRKPGRCRRSRGKESVALSAAPPRPDLETAGSAASRRVTLASEWKPSKVTRIPALG